MGGLGGLVLRPTSPSAASTGSVQTPASGGGPSMSGLSQPLSRGVGKEDLKILPAPPLATGLNLLLFSCQVVLGLQSPPQMTATHGVDPLPGPSLSSVCCLSSPVSLWSPHGTFLTVSQKSPSRASTIQPHLPLHRPRPWPMSPSASGGPSLQQPLPGHSAR